jgi:erythromycin esterase
MKSKRSRCWVGAGAALLLVPILAACGDVPSASLATSAPATAIVQTSAPGTTPASTANPTEVLPVTTAAPNMPTPVDLSKLTGAATNDQVIEWINTSSHPLTTTDPAAPLDDLAALEAIVGEAEIVGLGEATHGSSEIWTMKHRMLEYLVEHMGFTGFVLEADWPVGQQLDKYVLQGTGDPHTILSSFPWNSPEVVDVFLWMRAYNADPQHPQKLRVAGMDMQSITPAMFDHVTTYIATSAPDLLPQVQQGYAQLHATPGDLSTYGALPQPTKEQYAAQAQQVIDLLQQHESALVGRSSKEAFAWALQNGRAIRQFTHFVELASTNLGAAYTYHDQAMAENAGWWHEQHGKTIIWAHNGHVAKHTMIPQVYPDKVMGTFLRERFGDRYLSIGTSFGQGGYLAVKGQPGGAVSNEIVAMTLDAPAPNSSNAVLDRADAEHYLLDLRPAPAPTQAWLQASRPFRIAPAAAVDDPEWLAANTYTKGALGQWFDVLVQLRQVSAGHMPQC